MQTGQDEAWRGMSGGRTDGRTRPAGVNALVRATCEAGGGGTMMGCRDADAALRRLQLWFSSAPRTLQPLQGSSLPELKPCVR